MEVGWGRGMGYWLMLVGCGGGLGPVGHIVPYADEHKTVEPFTTLHGTINMSKGEVFEGYLTVRGGNDDIRFYIGLS